MSLPRGGEALPTRLPALKRLFRNSLSGVQLVEQGLGLLQIKRIESFAEPAVDRNEKIAGDQAVPQPGSFFGRARRTASRCG
jgi:hypothetical protein